MPHFFFDLHSPTDIEIDETGLHFDALEIAYIDVCRAIIDISAEMMKEQRDPQRFVFSIRDRDGRVVFEVPFREVLQPGLTIPPPPQRPPPMKVLGEALARAHVLKAELKAELDGAKAMIQAVSATLRRNQTRPL